jgi:sugar lactone lactonase YvrE
MTLDVELVLDARADLGEAPFWDAEAGVLVWVDITAGVIHRTDPETGEDHTLDVGGSVGSAVPAADGRLAIATDDGFSFVAPSTGRIEPIARIDTAPGVVMNDGKTDGAGRYWAGTKDAEGRHPLGSLFRLDPDRTVTEVVRGVTISNGLGWSPDRRTMYHIESATHGIDAYDTDPGSGSISRWRRLADFPRAWGLPDGMTVDAEGFLWVAFWTGSAVRRLDPSGNLVSTVELPVSLVTSCAFGGPDLGDLYVTTARTGLPEDQVRAEPHAGAVFLLRPGVRGVPSPPYLSTTHGEKASP